MTEQRVKQLERRVAQMSRLRDYIGDVVAEGVQNLKLRPLPERPKRRPRKHRPYEAVLTLADLQTGKVTASYDSDTAYDRVQQLAEPIINICDRFEIEKLHVWLLGDLVEGSTIFPAQAWSVDSPARKQATETVPQAIYDLIMRLVGKFRVISVREVAGNHGRAGHPRNGVPDRDNWDSTAAIVLYHMLTEARREGRVRMTLNDEWFFHETVCGVGCLGFHGHQLNSISSGTVQKRLLGWATDSSIPDWKYAFCGHWHQPQVIGVNDRYLYVSGSLDSDDKYAQEKLSATCDPMQRLFIFHPRGGLVADSMIRVQ